MSSGTSNFVIRWINFLTMLMAVGVIGFGLWMGIHHDGCRKSLTLPVIGLGGFILLVSLIGFLGAYKKISILLWIYLGMLCMILVAILVFTVLAFIITNNGTGHTAAGVRYKEYQLQDYSSWFQKQLNNTENWKHLKSCLVKSEDCNNLPKKYKTFKQYKRGQLTPIEAGCCRPPSHFPPSSSDSDCKLYHNSRAIKCYNCDSCKAGVAEYMKTEWRVVAIFNVVLFVILNVCPCVRVSVLARSSSSTRQIFHSIIKAHLNLLPNQFIYQIFFSTISVNQDLLQQLLISKFLTPYIPKFHQQ
ncbi:Tetraspanin-10 [Ranunculus cassubicifolius]